MKKVLPFDYVIIIGLIIIALIALRSYLRSDKYTLKNAKKAQVENIEEHNAIPRHVIQQGVYSFDYYSEKIITEKDKFDEYHTTSTKQLVGVGEVSFKYSMLSNKKISVVCDGIKQEILLGEVTGWSSPSYSTYSFDVLDWRATYINSNECFFIYDTTKSKKDTKLYLWVSSKGSPPSIYVDGADFPLSSANLLSKPISSNSRKRGLRSKPYVEIGTIIRKPIPLLQGIGSSIDLERFEYPYTDINPLDPYEYSTKAKYSPDMYDINTYKSNKVK